MRMPPIRAAVRTGDTPASERAAMLRHPPHILVTTPESLYLLLTRERGRQSARARRDGDRRRDSRPGPRQARLALALVARTARSPVRAAAGAHRSVGHAAADRRDRALPGRRRRASMTAGRPDCTIVDVGHVRELDLAHRSAAQRAVGGLFERAMGRDLPAAGRADSVASQHAGVRQHAPAGRARGPSSDANCWATRRSPAITAACRGRFASRPNSGSRPASSKRSSRPRRSRWASTSATSTWSARSARPGRSPRSCSASAARGTRWARFPRAGCFRSRATNCSNAWPWCARCGAGELDAIEIRRAAARYSGAADRGRSGLRGMGRDGAVRTLPPGVALPQA